MSFKRLNRKSQIRQKCFSQIGKHILSIAFFYWLLGTTCLWAEDRKEIVSVPDFKTLPPNAKIMSERTHTERDKWLAVLDPKHYINDYKARVMMFSGTDDLYFFMPLVLETYRAIPTPKRLIMLPNDHHSQVGNNELPLRYFRSIMGMAAAFPEFPLYRQQRTPIVCDLLPRSPVRHQ